MNINMIDASEKSNVVFEKTKYGTQSSDNARMAEMMAGYSLDITGKVMENAAYTQGELLSKEDISLEAGLVNVPNERNYMAVMSNSMSEDDFSELLKEGYNPTHTEIEESVTSLDRLKAKMAENGQIIEGFNDDLSNEEVKEALNIGSAIMPLSDDSMAYMIKNELEPTISNLYKSEHSSVMETYSMYGTAMQETEDAWDEIKGQAEKIIEASGIEVNEKSLDNAKWLVENKLPLNEQNLKAYESLEGIQLPASRETLLSAVNTALSEGKQAQEGNLLETENLYKKAAEIMDDFSKAEDGGDITRRRQLEETRLAMTVEANITLLRKGISIDTSDLEGLVEKLKSAEEEFYRPLLETAEDKGSEGTIGSKGSEMLSLRDRIDLFKETTGVIADLKEAPLETIGKLYSTGDEFNLRNLDTTAKNLAVEYEKAGKSYETMMTAPRADLGDSIKKAFGNIDEIIDDLGIEKSDENRRAIKIMGYSEIQINRESVAEIREAANTVTSVIEMMTPAKTLQMIREGHNPLTENLYELEKSLKNENVEETSEKYSEFLLKLERRGEISEDEKSAFIGMYRLFDKIERQDSKAIGRVLSAGEELTFKNLLTAYRSGRIRNLDVSVDDEFGALQDLITNGESITEQIEKGFKELKEEETPEEYIQDKLSDIRMASLEEEGKELLEELDMPVNIENILAAGDFEKRGRAPFRKITEEEDTEEGLAAKSAIREKAKELVNDFAEGEAVKEAYDDFKESARQEAEDMMLKAESYIDVKEWARLNRQIEIAGNMAKSDEYEVPVETDSGYVSVHLKLLQTGQGEGRVDISFESEDYGEVRASFTVDEDNVSGIVSARYEGGLEIIREKEEELRNALNNEGFSVENISYIRAEGSRENELAPGNAENRKLFKVAGMFLRAMEKETQYEN